MSFPDRIVLSLQKDNRNLIIFFITTFVWTWAFYIPIVLSGGNQLQMPWMILLIFGGMGPSIVGVALVLLTYDKAQRRDFWQRCFSFRRIPLLWWLVIFVVCPILFAVSIAIDLAIGGTLPGIEQLKGLMANPVAWLLAIFISFMSGPWSEEFGWRGYALKPLIKRFGIIPGTITLGIIWAVWHLPLYFMPNGWHGQMGFKLAGFWTFILFNVALSLVMTWVFMNTNQSILSGMLLHFTMNFTAQLISPYSDRVEILRAILLLAVGIAGCVLIDRKMRNGNSLE